MTPAELLVAARRRYATRPSHVPFGEFPAYPTECPIVALERAFALRGEPYIRGVYLLALERLYNASGWKPRPDGLDPDRRVEIMRWNAETSTEDVLAAFEKAIAVG